MIGVCELANANRNYFIVGSLGGMRSLISGLVYRYHKIVPPGLCVFRSLVMEYVIIKGLEIEGHILER